MNHKDNCFDSMRHFAALLVLFSHNFVVFGYAEPTFFNIQTLGGFAVIIFFSISGFLIAKSYIYSSSKANYLKKRIFRLFPGLFFCSFLLTYFYCGIWGRQDFLSWILSFESFKTFIFYSTTARNEWLILSDFFPSLEVTSNFINDRFTYYPLLNGPLWSLLYEIIDYILLLIVFSLFNNKLKVSIAIVILCFLIQIFLFAIGAPENQVSENRFLNYFANEFLYKISLLSIPFFMGAIIYLKSEYIFSKKIFLILVSIVSLLVSIIYPKLIMFYALGLPLLIIAFGLSFKDKIIKGKFDYSYGIYIYAWPIQQFFANIYKVNFIESFFMVLIFTLIFASISWHFVEKPFLSFSKSKI